MEENTSFESQKYANVSLSQGEEQMQKFLEENYGLTRDEFCSIVLWLDNFSLRFDDVERFEKIEDSLSQDFSLTPNDIFGILFSHGDIFCKDYSQIQADFEFVKDRYSYSKKDFAEMLKIGTVIDKGQIREIEDRLRAKYPDRKWFPMPKILKNIIEYADVDYSADIAYKLDLLGKFGVQLEDINGKFGFLKLSTQELTTRLKLMSLTNELPSSFLNVGYKTPNSRVYKLFLKFQADNVLKKKGYNQEYVNLKKIAESFDETKPLTENQLKDIDNKFAWKFKDIQTAISSLTIPEPKRIVSSEVQVGPANFEPIPEQTSQVLVENVAAELVVLGNSQEKKEPVLDAVESGKIISYVKNSSNAQVKKGKQTEVKGKTEFVQIDPAYKYVWTYMVKNFGLTYQEYPEVLERLNAERRNRLKEKVTDIEAVYTDISKDFMLSRQDFGQFFKYTLYGMAQRLALLECFGITPQDLARDDYANIPILAMGYDQLEYMLKIASVGKVRLEENLGRMAKYGKDTFLAKYIKFYEEGEKDKSMLDTPLTEREYQDIIYQKVPYYKRDKMIEKRYAETFPLASSFLEGYNENQRNLLMIVGFLIKKYGMTYVDAKKLVDESSKNFNEHTRIIQSKLDTLENLGFNPMQVVQNSNILRLPEEKASSRAILAKYLEIDDESFLRHYSATSEDKVFARMMGAMDIKPSYYYASEKVFSGLTGLSTEELMKAHKITIGQLSKLKKQIYERESKKQIESVFENSTETSQIFNSETQTPTTYSKDELDFRAYMTKNYGINSFEFNNTRNVIGASGLNFLNVAQFEKLLPILKRDFDISESEDISKLFKNSPKVFTNAFDSILSRYKFFEENFDMTRNGFKKLMMYADDSMLTRNDLIETFEKLKEMMLKEYGIELTKRDFVTIVRSAKCGENNSLYTLVDNALKILKDYRVEPSEIKSRFDFMIVDDMRTLETRLMLMHLLGESPNSYLSDGFRIQPTVLIERYLLYKQGQIPKSAIWLRTGEFEKLTGVKIDPEAHISASKRIEIAKDFAKKMKNVSFAPTAEIFEKKLQEKGKNEIVVRSNDYLTYMLSKILGADYKIANSARRRNTKFADVYARFMGVDKFMTNPNKYYLPEADWLKEAGVSTLELKDRFPIEEDTADIIKRAYFEKFPEDAFGIDGEFTKKLKSFGNAVTEKSAE